MQFVTLDNIKLRRVDRSRSMPVYSDTSKQEEFQRIRDSIRNKTYIRRSSSVRSSDEVQDTPSDSCNSLTSNVTSNAGVKTSCRSSLQEARTRSLSSKTSYELPTLRSTRSCPSAREYIRELEQAHEMLETCKEISSLTSDFTKEFKLLTKESVELPEVCLKLESYASDILVHLEGIKA